MATTAYAIGEGKRVAALRDLRILDTGSEPHLDAVCRTAVQLFKLPIAAISSVDETRLRFKARCGLDSDQIARAGAFATGRSRIALARRWS